MKQILREPLLHFLAIGVVLFAVFALVNDERPVGGNRIEITAEDIEQLVAIFGKQWQRPPNQQELQALIDARVREEVLYREALAMGLDKDDTIVRRRLAQKVEFLMADAGAVTEPENAVLQAYYEANAERYRQPPRLSFSHVYFSTDRRGEEAVKAAEALLARLRAARTPVTRVHDEGDPFMLPREYVDARTDEIARDFGRAFAEELVGLESGLWHGPVTSAYGIHLVYVVSRDASHLPPMEQLKERVANDWLTEQRRLAEERVYQRLRARYEISVAGQQARAP